MRARRHGLAGAVTLWVFLAAVIVSSPSAAQSIVQQAQLLPVGSADDRVGFTVAIDGTTMLVGAPRDDVGVSANQGSVYVYVLVDGVWVLQAHLVAADGAAGDQFGFNVALDGDTAVVGAPLADIAANTDQGAAYVFVRSGATWTQQQKLTATPAAAYDQFGWSAAVVGERVLIGAPHDYPASPAPGAAHAFLRSGGTWTFEKTFTGVSNNDQTGNSVALTSTVAAVGAPAATAASHAGQGLVRVYSYASGAWGAPTVLTAAAGAAGDSFGQSVAFSGKTLIVGATLHDVSGRVNQGAAYVFVSGLTGWTEQATLTASDGAAGDYFGDSVAIDGDTVLVGARLSQSGQGVAYVFTEGGSTWTQRARLTGPGGAAGDDLGRAVALHAGTAVVGAPLDDVATAGNQGSVTVFTGAGATWTAAAWLSGYGPEVAPWCGDSVAVSGDTLVVGASHDTITSQSGAVYVFVRSGAVWTLQAHFAGDDSRTADNFGTSVALSGDTLVVGAPWHDAVANADGAAYVFTRSAGTWTQQVKLTASDAASFDFFGESVAIAAGTIVVGATGADVAPVADAGAAYVFEPSGGTWAQRGKLVAPARAIRDGFGSSVALAGTTVIVGAPSRDSDATDTGAAHVFTKPAGTWTWQATLLPPVVEDLSTCGRAVAVQGDTALMGCPGATVGPTDDAGAVHVFTRTGTAWAWTQSLAAIEPRFREWLGAALAFEGDTVVAGASGASSNAGALYGFTRVAGTWRQVQRLQAAGGRSQDLWGSAVALSGDLAIGGTNSAPVAGLDFSGYAAVFGGLCQFGITPQTITPGAAGTTQLVTVNAGSSSCAWSTTSHAGWLTFDGSGTGTGDGGVTVHVADTTGPARSGTLTIAGQTLTVNQASGCTYTLGSNAASVGTIGGSGTVGLTVNNAACPWTAVSNAPSWLSITSAPNGTGSTTVSFSVLPNAGPQRVGTLTIAGQTFTVTQAGGCTYGLTASSAAAAAAGGTATVGVTASDAACPWTATSSAAWVTLTGGSAGTGPGTVTYDVAANTGPARSGTLTVAGLTFTVDQADGTTPPLPTTVYLAEGATSDFFDTQIALLNPGATAADVTLRYLRASGGPLTQTLTLPALRRTTVWPEQLLGAAEFSTVVESSVPLVVDRTMSWDGRGYGAHAETAVAAPALTWYLAEGATHSGFDLFYLVQNPNAAEAVVEVRYLRPAPLPVFTKTYTVPATSRFNIWVNLEAPELASTDVSAVLRVTNGQPVIVERAMYRSAPGLTFSAGHESAGVTAPACTWFLAEGNTGPFFDLFVLLANPNSTAADVRVTYLLPDGTTYTKTLTVAAESRANLWVDYDTPDGTSGFPLQDTAVSTTVTVTNDVPILVERAMWWPGDASRWYEAHNSPGATATGTVWALAEGEDGGARQIETYILVANASAFAGTATVTLLFDDGTSAVRTFGLPPNSRTNVAVAAEFPAAAGRRFGALIESTGATPAQIVVERAMYWNAESVPWAAGTNAMGTRLR